MRILQNLQVSVLNGFFPIIVSVSKMQAT